MTDDIDISGLVHTSVDDCSSAVFHASRAQLIAAHRWCEANPGNKSRRTIIARALRKRQLADDTEALMAAATAAATAAIRGERA